MLEKKRGNCKIHLLRIIGILEADFNTALKIRFARKLMALAESAGDLHEEQWGSKKTRTATNTSLQKMMTFEYGRYTKATIGLFSNDQTACSDRMWAETTNSIAAASGADANILKCRAITTENMTRHMKTGLGVLKASYSDSIPPESHLTAYLNRPTKTHSQSHSKDSDTTSTRNTAITKPTLTRGANNKQTVQIKGEIQGKADVASL